MNNKINKIMVKDEKSINVEFLCFNHEISSGSFRLIQLSVEAFLTFSLIII